ncbi:hypothetical protein QR680_014724 [Steinernema hermaphroditum]|uniref:Pepsin inhibitor-3-like repeated domain-containing protein n=1 Tax=Steinernema hermaphroditum TaxID=289476 RepID=A0AA39I9W2_9BILA|nr:hypothetical protein QR680_014724 [Steinernema hermaphroditum]
MKSSIVVILAFCLAVALSYPYDNYPPNWLRYSGPGPVIPSNSHSNSNFGNCRVQDGIVYESDGSSHQLSQEDAQKIADFQNAVKEWRQQLNQRVRDYVQQTLQNSGNQQRLEEPPFPQVPCPCTSGCN